MNQSQFEFFSQEYSKIFESLFSSLRERGFSISSEINFDSKAKKFELKVSGIHSSQKEIILEENLKDSIHYGFTQNIVGMTFCRANTKGVLQSFRIDGFKRRNYKNPIITTNLEDGSTWKFRPDRVKVYLGGDQLINRNANLEKLF